MSSNVYSYHTSRINLNKHLLMELINAFYALMDIHALDIFSDIINKGSFAEVAKHQNMSPSSISRMIANLDQELGVRLFNRTTRSLSPTEAGQNYFARISPLLEGLKEASHAVSDMEQQPQGTIKITSSVAFGLRAIVPLIPKFSEYYPDITIDYTLTDHQVDIINSGVDIAIRHGHLDDSSLIASRLLKTFYHVVASPSYIERYGHPQSPKDLVHHRIIVPDLPKFKTEWTFKDNQNNSEKVALTGKYIILNAIAIRDLCLQHCGVALLAHWLIDDDVEKGDLVQLFPDYSVAAENFDTAIWLITPSRAYMPSKIRVFLDFLKQELGSRA